MENEGDCTADHCWFPGHHAELVGGGVLLLERGGYRLPPQPHIHSNGQEIWQLGMLSDQNPAVDYHQVSVAAGSSCTNSTVVLALSLLPAEGQPDAVLVKAFWKQSRSWAIQDGATNGPRYLTGAYTNGFNLSSNTLTWTAPLPVISGTLIIIR